MILIIFTYHSINNTLSHAGIDFEHAAAASIHCVTLKTREGRRKKRDIYKALWLTFCRLHYSQLKEQTKRKKGINLCVIRLHEIYSWCVHHDELQPTKLG